MQRELGIERSWRAVAAESEDVSDRLAWWAKECVGMGEWLAFRLGSD
jgi:hypothetical protein